MSIQATLRSLTVLGLSLLGVTELQAQSTRGYTYDSVGNRTAATNQIRFNSTGAFSFRPRRAINGDRINIYGRNFPAGDPAGYSVSFNGVTNTVVAAGSRVVTVDVPAGVTSGPVVLTLPDMTQLDVGDLVIEGIEISPSIVSVTYSQQEPFSAQVFGSVDQSVIWAVDGVNGGSSSLGTISSVGVYTAPTNVAGRDFPAVITAFSAAVELSGFSIVEAACSNTAPLVIDTPIAGAIVGPTDRSCYPFLAPAGETLFAAYSGAASSRLVLRDSDGLTVERSVAGMDLIIAPIRSLFGGSFTLEVESASASGTGAFTVGVFRANDPALAYWVNPGDSLFRTDGNWLAGVVPDAGADVRASVFGTGTVQVSSSPDPVNNLTCDEGFELQSGTFTVDGIAELNGPTTIEGGVLTGSGNVQFNVPLTWSAGTLSATGPNVAHAGFTLTGNATKTLSAGTLRNTGSAVWTGLGRWRILGSAVFENAAGALLDVQNGELLDDSTAGGTIVNDGTIQKSVSTDTTTLASLISLVNNGLLDVHLGIFSLTGGGTNTSSMLAQSGAIIDIGTNPYHFGVGATMAGGGFLRLSSGGDLVADGNCSVENLRINSNGLQSGAADLSVTTVLEWDGGTMSGSGKTLTSGLMVISGAGTKILDERTLENSGTLQWTGPGRVRLTGDAVFDNLSGATFEIQNAELFEGASAGGSLENAGTIQKTLSTGTTSVTGLVEFNNTGLVDVQLGNLSLSGGGTNSGVFQVSAGAFLDFGSNPYHLALGSTMTGFGFLRVQSGGTLFADGDCMVESLRLNPGGLQSGAGDLTVPGTFEWAGGDLSGKGETVSTGVFELSGAGTKILNGRTLRNMTTCTWTGNGNWRLQAGGVFENALGALLDIQNDRLWDDAATGGLIENNGTLRKSAGAGATTVANLNPLNNAGLIEVESGTLNITGGGTSTGFFDVASSGVVDFSGMPYHLAAGTSMTGMGFMRISSGGDLVCDGNSNFERVHLRSGGTQSGAADLEVSGEMLWEGGTLVGTGRTISSFQLTIDGAGTKIQDGRTLRNTGTATFDGNGNWRLQGNAVFENAPGALVNILNDRLLDDAATGGVISNSGTWRKSGGLGATTFSANVELNNDGLVDILTGTLSLTGGGTNTSSMTAASGAFIDLSSQPYHFATGATMSGDGFLRANSGSSLVADGNCTVENLRLNSGGMQNGPGDLTVSGALEWNNGRMEGAGLTIVTGSIDLLGAGTGILSERTLRNTGSSTWSGAGAFRIQDGGVFENAVGALFDIQVDRPITQSGTGGPFNNLGTLRKSAGAGTTSFGTLIPLTNAGVIELQTGTLSCTGGFTQTAGMTLLAGGAINATPLVDLQGGSLEGAGNVLTDLTNAGAVVPGQAGAIGTLNVTDDYVQSAAGALNLDLEGLAGGSFDSLTVTGTATLGGTLNVSLSGGFTPSVGDTFVVLSAGTVSGTFATENLPAAVNWSVNYGATSVTLEVIL